jgi:hypothetical protein
MRRSGYSRYGGSGIGGALGLVLIIVLGLWFFGGPHQYDDPHLRSSNAVMRYYAQASDGDLGHVQGFLVDERSWAIRYLIVNTSNWWPGHKVLIPKLSRKTSRCTCISESKRRAGALLQRA